MKIEVDPRETTRAEAFDLLQAMNTGHEGSLTTLHANNPKDALTKRSFNNKNGSKIKNKSNNKNKRKSK